eukprot:COSAG02_NODE_1_length_108762_cov_456.708287_26_plen_166_part_00
MKTTQYSNTTYRTENCSYSTWTCGTEIPLSTVSAAGTAYRQYRRYGRCAVGDFGPLLHIKNQYSACMNSFRIQRLDSFHAISHGFPIRPGSGPPRPPNRSGTARVHDVRLLAPPWYSCPSMLVMLVSSLPTDPHVSDAVGSQVTRYARYAPRTLISVLQSRSSGS